MTRRQKERAQQIENAKRKALPLADGKEEFGGGSITSDNGATNNGRSGKGTMELNETERLMIFGLQDCEENQPAATEEPKSFENPETTGGADRIDKVASKEKRLLTPCSSILGKRRRTGVGAHNYGEILDDSQNFFEKKFPSMVMRRSGQKEAAASDVDEHQGLGVGLVSGHSVTDSLMMVEHSEIELDDNEELQERAIADVANNRKLSNSFTSTPPSIYQIFIEKVNRFLRLLIVNH